MSSISAVSFTSPIYEIDPATGVTVQEYRDPQSGDPLYQVPSEAQLQAQAATASTGPAPTTPGATTPTPTTPATTTASAPLYPSPEIEIDGADGRVILQYRDEVTGALQYQVPSAAQITLYQHTQADATAKPPAASDHAVNSET